MCRFLAYQGEPIFLGELVASPCHSLIHQSMHAEEAKTVTNGDGFGIGWYGERPEPGLYRELRPAWSDENLLSICTQVRSPLFFAHVRAATGTATSRANCHPFAHGRHLFMHNGQIGGYSAIRRRVEAMIPDHLYSARTGTTDSEAIFLAALGRGLADDPVGAIAGTLHEILCFMQAAGISSALRFAATLSDGENFWAFRWASDEHPPTLYYKQADRHLTVVSEPIDGCRNDWQAMPKGSVLTAIKGQPVRIDSLDEALAAA